ncbi:hypothetical protein L1987_49397 [Smallanthus sonchifolius]|uniref:Uncharacterized protein n=1 Tax=Smallanthus sonchifolius TaxID=185202 RepID=A0ACB9FVG7_9ASTR|nr:hypothetical protein L1987_49397 [Smallanthus sonchifolius]
MLGEKGRAPFLFLAAAEITRKRERDRSSSFCQDQGDVSRKKTSASVIRFARVIRVKGGVVRGRSVAACGGAGANRSPRWGCGDAKTAESRRPGGSKPSGSRVRLELGYTCARSKGEHEALASSRDRVASNKREFLSPTFKCFVVWARIHATCVYLKSFTTVLTCMPTSRVFDFGALHDSNKLYVPYYVTVPFPAPHINENASGSEREQMLLNRIAELEREKAEVEARNVLLV